MKSASDADGFKTCDGHAETQSWHAVHFSEKCAALIEPGGVILKVRLGERLALIGASPPSVVFSSAFAAAELATSARAVKNPRRPFESASDFAGLVAAEFQLIAFCFAPFGAAARCCAFSALPRPLIPYEIAEFLHLPMQSKQSTQRE